MTAVDGSILEIPNTKELQEEYVCQFSCYESVRKSARAKASGIYDVENNIMIDAVIDKYITPQRPLAKRNIENMIKILGYDKKIISIFDRGYILVEMLIFLMDLPIFYLFRVQGVTYAEEKDYMISDDEIVSIKVNGNRLRKVTDEDIKNKAKQIDEIKVRMIRIPLPTGEDEYLVTNIPYEEMGTNDIGKLYFKRWGIEGAYDVIKNKLCIEKRR